jgi:hypothetical protein
MGRSRLSRYLSITGKPPTMIAFDLAGRYDSNNFATISGPMPPGSPIVTASTGLCLRDFFVIHRPLAQA